MMYISWYLLILFLKFCYFVYSLIQNFIYVTNLLGIAQRVYCTQLN